MLLLLATSLITATAPGAWACPAEELQERAGATSASADDEAAAHPAHTVELLGRSGAWSTALLARRVVSTGRDWRYTGQIVRAESDPAADVAAPFRLQAGEGGWVLATELLELLIQAGHELATLELAGRRLRADDGEYFVVLTSWRVINQ